MCNWRFIGAIAWTVNCGHVPALKQATTVVDPLTSAMFKMVLALPFASVVAAEAVSVPDPTVRTKFNCSPAAGLPSPFNAFTASVNDTVLPDAANLDGFTAASTSSAA